MITKMTIMTQKQHVNDHHNGSNKTSDNEMGQHFDGDSRIEWLILDSGNMSKCAK